MIEIKRVIADVDGSFTDGGVYYFDDGHTARKFSTFDGEGVKYLQQAGVVVVLLTASDSAEIIHRAKWLNVPVYAGVKDKAAFLKRNRYNLKQTAYFGNDVNDLDAMYLCAFAACPADAHERVLMSCKVRSLILADAHVRYTYAARGFVSKRNGGNGAFREFADMLIGYEFTFMSGLEREEAFNNLDWIG